MSETHELKTWPNYFETVFKGHKRFEVRKNDRGFMPGDILLLKEYDPDTKEYSGREMETFVSYVIYGNGNDFLGGLKIGYCIMSIMPVSDAIELKLIGADDE